MCKKCVIVRSCACIVFGGFDQLVLLSSLSSLLLVICPVCPSVSWSRRGCTTRDAMCHLLSINNALCIGIAEERSNTIVSSKIQMGGWGQETNN